MANDNHHAFDPQEYVHRSYSLEQTNLISRVFVWMGLGLVVSGVVAFLMAATPNAQVYYLTNSWFVFGSVILQFALVFGIGAGMGTHKISASAMTVFFFIYSILMGISLSGVFLMYTAQSIYGVFFISAGTFLAMAFYGYTTKSDLTQLGSFLVMGLFGIIIASLVNIFFRSEGMTAIISFLGVLVFIGLTAYDTQKIKALGANLIEGSEQYRKAAIWGALTLYLDLINLFFLLLRLMGNRRE